MTILAFFRKMINRIRCLLRPVYEHQEVVILGITGPGQTLTNKQGFAIRREFPQGHDPISAVMRDAGHWDDAQLQQRKLSGDACYTVFRGDRCVHYSWVSYAQMNIEEVGYKAAFHGEDCWIYNCYTAPECRGQSIYPYVLSQIIQEFSLKNGRRGWVGTLRENKASWRGIIKAGFQEVAVIKRTVWFSLFHSQSISFLADGDWRDHLLRLGWDGYVISGPR